MTVLEAAMASPAFKRVMPITLEVHPDEKAYWLWEIIVQSRGNRGWRRAQVMYVNRGGNLARWAKDLGPADAFKAEELSIPSVWVHTVGQLLDMAEKARLGDDYWQRFLDEEVADETFIPNLIAQYQERRLRIRNRSTIGPYVTRQRNEFPAAAVARRAKEIRHGNRG
jgi:hypothetical protein